MPFSLTPIPGTNAILSADPAVGFEIYDFDNRKGRDDETVATSRVTAVSGQKAICWSTFSSRSGNFYLVDAGSAVVREVHIAKNLDATVVAVSTTVCITLASPA